MFQYLHCHWDLLGCCILLKPFSVALTIGETDGEDSPAVVYTHAKALHKLPQLEHLSPQYLQYAVGRVPADNHSPGAQLSHAVKPRFSIS